jgi:hypothetical protein
MTGRSRWSTKAATTSCTCAYIHVGGWVLSLCSIQQVRNHQSGMHTTCLHFMIQGPLPVMKDEAVAD